MRMVLLIMLITWNVFLWGFIAYDYWRSNQPIRDVGPCVQGMTLPPRSSCHTTLGDMQK